MSSNHFWEKGCDTNKSTSRITRTIKKIACDHFWKIGLLYTVNTSTYNNKDIISFKWSILGKGMCCKFSIKNNKSNKESESILQKDYHTSNQYLQQHDKEVLSKKKTENLSNWSFLRKWDMTKTISDCLSSDPWLEMTFKAETTTTTKKKKILSSYIVIILGKRSNHATEIITFM